MMVTALPKIPIPQNDCSKDKLYVHLVSSSPDPLSPTSPPLVVSREESKPL